MAEEVIRCYLETPPYYGRSGFHHAALVKQLCGSTRTWDPVRKLWGTKCTDALQDLVASGKWHPVGIEHEWKGHFQRAAQKHREDAQAQWHAQQEAQRAAAAATEAAAAALKRRTPASWVIASRTPKKPKNTTASAQAPEAPRAPTPRAPSDAPKRAGVEPSPAEVAECARLGFTDEAIAFSDTLNMLGPRGTLSHEGRILRWCHVLTSEARYVLAGSADYFEPNVYLPKAEEKHREFAADLNAQATAHAAPALA